MCPVKRAKIVESKIKEFLHLKLRSIADKRKDNQRIAMIRFIRSCPEEICKSGKHKGKNERLINSTLD